MLAGNSDIFWADMDWNHLFICVATTPFTAPSLFFGETAVYTPTQIDHRNGKNQEDDELLHGITI